MNTVRIIVVYQNQVLFLQKSSDSKNPNAFEFPGGKVDEGLSELQTATKELEEETGIMINQTKFVNTNIKKQYSFTNGSDVFNREVKYFLLKLEFKPEVILNISEDKHTNYIWVDLDNYENFVKENIVSMNSDLGFEEIKEVLKSKKMV